MSKRQRDIMLHSDKKVVAFPQNPLDLDLYHLIKTILTQTHFNPNERLAMPLIKQHTKGIQLFQSHYVQHLIERNLRRSLHALGILVEGAVGLVALFLNGGAVLHQLLRDGLASGLEDVDESAGEVLLGFAEEGDGETVLAGTTGTAEICQLRRMKLVGHGRTYRPIRWT